MSRPRQPAGDFGGGFFLPAQRSMHCKGGFFTSAVTTPTPAAKPLKPPARKPVPASRHSRRAANQETHEAPKRGSLPLLDASVQVKYETALQELQEIKGQIRARPPMPTPTPDAADAPELPSELPSPAKKLQIAEAVIRKLYKKNLELEKALAAAKSEAVAHCATEPLVHPPTPATVEGIAAQKEVFLRSLAAEQDRTIRGLQLQLQQLRTRPVVAADAASSSAIPRLQQRLQEALDDASRQRANYARLQREHDQLLGRRARTLAGNGDIDRQARETLQLLEARLAAVEREREQEALLLNLQLFETEKRNCDSYVAQKLLEDEMASVVQGVEERDAIDDQIDKCMLGLFERLHHVERENVQLRGR
ncbi:hypothetical protein ACHHYP_07996 [Achlya hypogyna]|uniref:Uncharacterized protein n=1 Tax=Achlya hypogyna TaxID=1202772 RepID=A0A1V9YQ20_ACHHY|nr:hypothetical protein ACHHYP_07996 [Achlya hypogyna]